MITIVKNVQVYSPKSLGKKDVLIVGDKFEGIYNKVEIPNDFININKIDGNKKIMFPGFIDSHVHIIGGGGEGGFNSRTPEINLTDLSKAGITTVIGCLGTDSVCRDLKTLIAKAKALEEEGITTFCYTGSYQVPIKTITDDIQSDLMLIDKIIGVGEIALSDHRSSQPTYQQFINLVAQARVGGLLSGKSGVVNIHLGNGERGLKYLFWLIANSEIPPTQLLPTHINRKEKLFIHGIEYMKKGGYIDFTTSADPLFLEPTELRASDALSKIIEQGLPIDRVTFSSDGNGSMPIFNKDKELVGLGICSVSSLYEEVRRSIIDCEIPIETAIKVITSNVANVFQLKNRGEIKTGNIADFVLVNQTDLNITDVYAKGSPLIIDSRIVKKGIFE